jgi:hypothetical protein
MLFHRFAVCGITLVSLAGYGAQGAQSTGAPTDYTVTSTNSMAGPVTSTTTYRSGSKVVVDERTPAPVAVR